MTDDIRKSIRNVTEVAKDLIFKPTAQQRKAKAAFWATIQDNPIYEGAAINVAQAVEITSDGRVHKWWKLDGFADWFRNKDEFRQKLEYLCTLALDSAEDVLLSEDPKAINAKVSMIKVLMETAGKMAPKQKEVKMLDKTVQDMDQKQLEEYLARVTKLTAAKE